MAYFGGQVGTFVGMSSSHDEAARMSRHRTRSPSRHAARPALEKNLILGVSRHGSRVERIDQKMNAPSNTPGLIETIAAKVPGPMCPSTMTALPAF